MTDSMHPLAVGGTVALASLASTLATTAGTDVGGLVAQFGMGAGAIVVAYVAFGYVRKRDEDNARLFDRQEKMAKENRDDINRLFEAQEKGARESREANERIAKENRDANAAMVQKMDSAIRDVSQVHSNGLAQVSGSINTMISTVTTFQKTQDEMLSEMEQMKTVVAVLANLNNVDDDAEGDQHRPKDKPDPSRSDSKRVRIPRQLPPREGS